MLFWSGEPRTNNVVWIAFASFFSGATFVCLAHDAVDPRNIDYVELQCAQTGLLDGLRSVSTNKAQ